MTHIQKIVLPRWLAINAWCAMVSVTPEVSSSAVLIVGSGQNGPMVVKGSTVPAGEAVTPPPALGQMALKSGHRIWWSRLPSIGSACTRAQYSAPKKAAKNITSEKMNQLMLQRKETSMRSEYMAAFALAHGLAEPLEHHRQPDDQAEQQRSTRPSRRPLTHWPAPRMTRNRPKATSTGWRDGLGDVVVRGGARGVAGRHGLDLSSNQ